jgi:hypothetical protein
MGFSLADFSDRELVHVVTDLAEDGWTLAKDVAKRVGTHERNVTMRFAWMRRFGILEISKEPPTRWRLTKDGASMLHADRNYFKFGNLKDADLVHASHALTQRFSRAAIPHQTMTRREWQRTFKG